MTPLMNREPGATVSVLSLRSRTLIFLILLTILSSAGVGLMWASQERLATASTQIQEILIPAGRLIEEAKSEIDLQIQELTILAGSATLGPVDATPLRPRLRLSPGVRSLLALQSSPLFPAMLEPMFKPWADQARQYEGRVPELKGLNDALPPLRELQQKTVLLKRAVERELSVQLLGVTKGGREHLQWGTTALGVAVLVAIIFVWLVRLWMKPLERLRRWTEQNADDPRARILEAQPPRSVLGGGPLAPPAEVQSLTEAFRRLIHALRTQASEIDARSRKLGESERAQATMFSALMHITRRNEQLLKELIKNERLASMGEMAAQLAHEIRNPLNSLNLKLELLREELPPELRPPLDRVLVEIDRLDALTESHLRTTRSLLKADGTELGLPPAPAAGAPTSNLQEIIDAVIDTMSPELHRRGIFVQRAVDDGGIETRVPGNILKAALMNFMKNAAEALDGTDPKVIRVHAGRDARGHWTLSVADTGCGLPREMLDRPIESFHTTKADGSGLGLVTSQNMLAPYGVKLEIRSPAGSFATELEISNAPASETGISTDKAPPAALEEKS